MTTLTQRRLLFGPRQPRALQLTLSASPSLVNDAVRALGVQGDGLAVGTGAGTLIEPASTNRITNSHGKTNTTGWLNGLDIPVTIARQADATYITCLTATCTSTSAAANMTATVMSGGSKAAGQLWAARGAIKASPGLVGKTVRLFWWESGGAFGDQTSGSKDFVLTANWQEFTNALATIVRADRTILYLFIQLTGGMTSGDVLYFTAMQGENLGFSTSWITTDGAPVTRNAGSVQMAAAGTVDVNHGYMAFSLLMPYASTNVPVYIELFRWDNSGTEVYEIYGTAGRQFFLTRKTGGNTYYANTSALTWAAGDKVFICCQWSPTQIQIAANNGTFVSLADTHIPTIATSTFDFGRTASGGSPLYANICWAAGNNVGGIASSDSQALNGYKDTPGGPTVSQLPGGVGWVAPMLNGWAQVSN